MVFKSLRIGFPTARVVVHTNCLSDSHEAAVAELAAENDCEVKRVSTIHHVWIEELVGTEQEPFYICDTDLHFFRDFQLFAFKGALAGWRIPEWRDEFSGAITRARLHTSLLYINPVMVREAMDRFKSGTPDTPFTPIANLFNPLIVPLKGTKIFYDTCSMLYQAIGGEAFGPAHKNAYVHLHYGTISDLVLPRLPDPVDMEMTRKAILDNPALGVGQWRNQTRFYEQRRV